MAIKTDGIIDESVSYFMNGEPLNAGMTVAAKVDVCGHVAYTRVEVLAVHMNGIVLVENAAGIVWPEYTDFLYRITD